MINMKPTEREVKVILNSFGLKFSNYMFDTVEHVDRIKMRGYQMSTADMSRMRVMLQMLFPYLEIKVGQFKSSTVVKFS